MAKEFMVTKRNWNMLLSQFTVYIKFTVTIGKGVQHITHVSAVNLFGSNISSFSTLYRDYYRSSQVTAELHKRRWSNLIVNYYKTEV